MLEDFQIPKHHEFRATVVTLTVFTMIWAEMWTIYIEYYVIVVV